MTRINRYKKNFITCLTLYGLIAMSCNIVKGIPQQNPDISFDNFKEETPLLNEKDLGDYDVFLPLIRSTKATPRAYSYAYQLAETDKQLYISQAQKFDDKVVRGTYEYIDPNNDLVIVNYVADENGYRQNRTVKKNYRIFTNRQMSTKNLNKEAADMEVSKIKENIQHYLFIMISKVLTDSVVVGKLNLMGMTEGISQEIGNVEARIITDLLPHVHQFLKDTRFDVLQKDLSVGIEFNINKLTMNIIKQMEKRIDQAIHKYFYEYVGIGDSSHQWTLYEDANVKYSYSN